MFRHNLALWVMGLIGLGLAVLFVLIVIAYLVLIVAASYFEKRLVDPYREVRPDELDSGTPPWLLSHYVKHMSDRAMAAGFEFGSMVLHVKYPVSGTVWISPDRTTLFLTGSGKVIGLAAKKSWLITPLSDGRWLITTDQPGEGETDGTEDIETEWNVEFPILYQAHLERIRKNPLVAEYPPGRPFDLLATRAQLRALNMIERGIARYRDPEKTTYSLTLLSSLGAVARVFGSAKKFANRPDRNVPPVGTTHWELAAGPLVRGWIEGLRPKSPENRVT